MVMTSSDVSLFQLVGTSRKSDCSGLVRRRSSEVGYWHIPTHPTTSSQRLTDIRLNFTFSTRLTVSSLSLVPLHWNSCIFCAQWSRTSFRQWSSLSTCVIRPKCCVWNCRSLNNSVSPVQSLLCDEHGWYQSYLSDRTKSFGYAGQQSTSCPVHCSAPQGSVLGPVESTTYTEDITELLIRHETKSHLYADDTQLYASCRSEDIDAE